MRFGSYTKNQKEKKLALLMKTLGAGALSTMIIGQPLTTFASNDSRSVNNESNVVLTDTDTPTEQTNGENTTPSITEEDNGQSSTEGEASRPSDPEGVDAQEAGDEELEASPKSPTEPSTEDSTQFPVEDQVESDTSLEVDADVKEPSTPELPETTVDIGCEEVSVAQSSDEDCSEDDDDEFGDIPGYDPSKPYVLIEGEDEGFPGILYVSEGITYKELITKLEDDWGWDKIALYSYSFADNEEIFVLINDPNHVMSLYDILVRDELVDFIDDYMENIKEGEEYMEPPEGFEDNLLLVLPFLPPYEEEKPERELEEVEKTILDTSIKRKEVDLLKGEVKGSLQTEEDKNNLVLSLETELNEVSTGVKTLSSATIAKYEVAVSTLVEDQKVDKAVELSILFLQALGKQNINQSTLKEYVRELISGFNNKKEFLSLLISNLEKDGIETSALRELLGELGA